MTWIPNCIFIDTTIFAHPGRANWSWSTTSQAFEADIRNSLTRISNTKSGDALIRSIQYHASRNNEVVAIKPFLPFTAVDESKGACNSVVGDNSSTVDPATDIAYRLLFGKKIAAVIGITPGRYSYSHVCTQRRLAKGQYFVTLDEVLFHELCHAFRILARKYMLKGNALNKVAGGMTTYDRFEEFFAVFITCIFQSENGYDIRASHHGHYKMDEAFDTSLEYFRLSKGTFEMVKRLCDSHKGLSKMLASVKTDFNPIHSYYHNPEKARANSNSTLAKWRDAGPFGPLSKGSHFLSWEMWGEFMH